MEDGGDERPDEQLNEAGVAAVVRDPAWLPHRYDPGRDTVHFIRVDRERRARATFLTDDYLGPVAAPVVLPRGLARAAMAAPGALHFVFHSAFCCSTLVAQALDRPGWATALKEPVILNDLVGWRRAGAPPARVRAVLDDVLALLARPMGPGEAVVVKPSNIVAGLMPEMLALRPSARALLMHAPLRLFLTSIAKKGLDGRLWTRRLMAGLLRDGLVRFGFTADDLFEQTDLQVAALGWLAQHALFAAVAQARSERVRTVSSEALLADPAAAMGALAALFALPRRPALIAEVAAGPGFTRHSKTGEAFGRDDRARDYGAAATAHADEIDKVEQWAMTVAAHHGLSPTPAAPLMG